MGRGVVIDAPSSRSKRYAGWEYVETRFILGLVFNEDITGGQSWRANGQT